MANDNSRSKFISRAVIAVFGAWILALAAGFATIPYLVKAGYQGKSIGFVNQKVVNRINILKNKGEDHSAEAIIDWAYVLAVKVAVPPTLVLGAAALLAMSGSAWRRFKRFFFCSADPINLGLFRVVLFLMLLSMLRVDAILYYASWERESYIWPQIARQLYMFLPVTTGVAEPLQMIACVTCVMAAIGLFTRFSTTATVLLSCYLLGIPQLSGKISHYHHILIMGVILMLSRCGDALSVDSLIRAIRRADRGVVRPVSRSVNYGMPIRIAMFALALVYFFPGYWKVATNGPEWVFSNNLENHMLRKWFYLETFTPIFPLHEMPLAGPMGALFAIVFEIFFLPALFWSWSRNLLALMGFSFHNLTYQLMKIGFFTLQWMYVLFIDWSWLFRRIGKAVFGEKVQILYDGNCKLCRRTIGLLGACDWLQTMRPLNALDEAALAKSSRPGLDRQELLKDMHTLVTRKDGSVEVHKGYEAYRPLCWRLPLLWPLLPFVYLPPVTALGKSVYARVADSRTCSVPTQAGAATPLRLVPRWWATPLMVAATGMFSVQYLLGSLRETDAWPFACYPLFDVVATNEIDWPEFTVLGTDGSSEVMDDDAIRASLGESLYVPSMVKMVTPPIDHLKTNLLLREFVKIWRKTIRCRSPRT